MNGVMKLSRNPLHRRVTVRFCIGILLAVFVFFASIIDLVLPLRVVAIVLGCVALVTELWLATNNRASRAWWTISVFGAAAILTLAIEALAHQLDDRVFAVNAEHILVVAPLFGTFGALVVRHRAVREYGSAYLMVASLTAALALLESILGVSVIGRTFAFLTSQREGTTRALVGAEHVLVLGALLAVGVALAAGLDRWQWRAPVTALLLTGCWASGSRAAAALSALVVVIQASPMVVRFMQRAWVLIAGAATLGFAGLAVLGSTVWTTHIAGMTGLAFSSNYRFASYATLVQILDAKPLGYLLQAVPTQTWMMQSDLRGPVDLALSADSELVFSVFVAGWIGVVVYLGTFWLACIALPSHPILGMTTLLLTSLGIIMALHGWDAASVIWYALLGACAGAAMSRRSDPRRAGIETSAPVIPSIPEQGV